MVTPTDVALSCYERDWRKRAGAEKQGLLERPAVQLFEGDVFTYAGAFRWHRVRSTHPDTTYPGRVLVEAAIEGTGRLVTIRLPVDREVLVAPWYGEAT